ncbi:DUF3488 and transglutaminase-like domain-containing protein [Nocardiopsis sediminis]|uniref:DUF3488 and transglutaminase-like domain-containing protein n=1 Tax=Nocardiopsis sediminis TaxID=1778267 RepID=A0ABV8FT92_9ACTN
METLTLRRSGPAASPPTLPAPAVRRMEPLVAGAALAGSVAAGGVAMASAYASPLGAGTVLFLAAAASVALTLLLRSRVSSFAALLAGTPMALLGMVALAAWAPGSAGGPIADALRAIPLSGGRILSSPPPIPVMVDTLAFPALATWLGGAAGALACASGRIHAALLPGLVLLTGAAAVNGAPPSGVAAAAVLLCSDALLLAVSSAAGPTAAVETSGVRVAPDTRSRETVSGRGWAVRLAACGAAAALVATAAPPVLSAWRADPYDPQSGAVPAVAPLDARSPLGYLSVWAANPDTRLLTVRSNRVVRLRWVALADFTGTTWQPEAAYSTTGRLLPDPDPAPPNASRQTATVDIDALPGPWLPVVGSPRSLGLPGAGYDPASGTAIALDGEITGLSYEVSGDVAHWRPEELADLRPPSDPGFDRYRYLPGELSPQMDAVVDGATASGTPYEHAVSLARYLRTGYTFDPEAPGGHGLADLGRLLVEPGQQGGGGTSEQFASAFAVLARAAGLPSRVAVGFDSGTQSADGEFTVATGDAIAWGEVYFDGVGWVPFDVTPGGREGGGDPGEPSAPAGTEDGPGPVSEEPESAPHDIASPVRPDDSGAVAPALVAGVAAALVVLAVVIVAALRLGRSRRRLAPGRPAPDSVLGAWQELREALALAGTGPGNGATVTDVVKSAAQADPTGGGARRLRYLHRSVNAVAFGAAGNVTDEAAVKAAEEVRAFVRDLRAGQGRIRRWTWWLDPRPLRNGEPTSERRRRRL